MAFAAVSKLYEKACPYCGGDVLFSQHSPDDQDLVCLQGAHRFNRVEFAPELDTTPPDGMTSRLYVQDRLEGLLRGGITEVNHVEWLICRGAKEGCTLASAIRDYRRRYPWREYIQQHGYPAIFIKRIY